MTRSDDIVTLWESLELKAPGNFGFLRQRVSAECKPALFAGLKLKTMARMLILRVRKEHLGKHIENQNFRGFQIEVLQDTDSHDKRMLINLVLVEPRFQELFTVLAEDIVSAVCPLESERSAVSTFFARIHDWKTLFESYISDGLTIEQQQGLFGEFWFMRLLLQHSLSAREVVRSWMGHEGGHQDFQLSDWAVEVKTTTSKQHHQISISNEKQLDDAGLSKLYMYVLKMDRRQEQGETLPQILASIRELLSNDSFLLGEFNSKVLQVGYHTHHASLYNDRGYNVLTEHQFLIKDGFPRIIGLDLPEGVGNVHYSIELTQCTPFSCDFEQLIYSLKSDG